MRFCVLLSLVLLATPSLAAEVTLDAAFRDAEARSEVLGKAEQQIEQATEKKNQFLAGIFPEISGNFQYQHQDTPADPIAAQGFPVDQTSFSVGLKQPIFRGFREWAALDGARKLRDSRMAARDSERIKLFLDVAKAYLDVLAQEQDLKNLNAQIEIYARRVSDLRARAKRGESQQTEALTAEASQMSLDAEARLVEAQLAEARERFQFLTNLPSDTTLVDPNALAEGKNVVPPLEGLLKRVEERPDVRSAIKAHESADSEVAFAWRAHSPKIDAFANYYFERPGFFRGIAWDVGITASIPIFEGGATQAKVRENVAKRKEMELELERTRRSAVQEIKVAHEKLAKRVDYLQRIKQAAELTEKNVKLLERDYRRGLARNIDVQQGLSDLNTTKRGYDKARFAAELELYQLQAASNTLPEKIAN